MNGIVAVALGLLLVAGCESKSPSTAGGAKTAAEQTESASTSFDPDMTSVCQACATRIPYQEGDVVAQPGAKRGKLTRCVVSGVVFVVTADHPKVEHAGNSYILCCDACAGKFSQNPGRFARS